MKPRNLAFGSAICLLCLVACTSYNQQSVMDPAAPEAASIHKLFLFMLAIAVVVYIVVVGAFLVVVARRSEVGDDDLRSPAREATALRWIKIAVGVTVPILFVFLIYDLSIGRNLNKMPGGSMLTIDVTGHQWWWEVEYEDPLPQNRVRTANEIHIPVGKQVLFKLASHDVIHSFWVPNLTGKKDLIPGHDNELLLRADHPGIFRGPCAEYCGIEHAKMALLVIAEPEAQFVDWLKHQRAPSLPPTDSLAWGGRVIFETGSCATCHTIAGTRAAATVGPNLTHLMTRSTIAAGTLQNTKGNLAGWIVDPQSIKPGAKMPTNQIAPKDLQALLAYLETLK